MNTPQENSDSKEAAVELRRLAGPEILAGIDLFARSVPRHWPVSTEEARKWVAREFQAPASAVFGYFWEKKLVGVNALCPFKVAMEDIDPIEIKLLTSALTEQFAGMDLAANVMHWGGLAVDAEFEGMGIAKKMAEFSVNAAKELGLKGLFCQCALPNKSCPNLHGVDIAKHVGFQPLLNGSPLTYPSSRLEKLWLYKVL